MEIASNVPMLFLGMENSHYLSSSVPNSLQVISYREEYLFLTHPYEFRKLCSWGHVLISHLGSHLLKLVLPVSSSTYEITKF